MSPDPQFRFVCDVCGGPRVPTQAPRKRSSAKENNALKRADGIRKSRAKYRGGAIAAGVATAGAFGLFGLIAILSVVFGWSIAWSFLGALLTAGPLAGLTAWLASRASARSKELPHVIDEAWMAAATDVIEQSSQAVTAGALAKALNIEEPQAEELLALLEASDIVRADGNFAYRPRLRIEAPSTQPASDNLAAEVEAQAEAEALAQQQSVKRERL
jgi:hypothetical protein